MLAKLINPCLVNLLPFSTAPAIFVPFASALLVLYKAIALALFPINPTPPVKAIVAIDPIL